MGGRVNVGRTATRCVLALAMAGVVLGLSACQQEMSRKDKGYSLPSFKGLPAPAAPKAQLGSSQNKGDIVGSSGS